MGRLQAQGKQWALLALFSLGLGMLFLWLHLPAALLLGPMLAAVVMGLRGATIRVHGLAMPLAQSISVSYTHLTLPTTPLMCRSRWSPYH